MGFFDFLKSSNKKKEVDNVVKNTIPTIKPEKELFECYSEVFKRESSNVIGITGKEFDEIYKIISQSDGGYLNAGAYHTKVYDSYFKGRDWAWTEYDKWSDRFHKLGRFPTSFPERHGPITVVTALGLLSVSDLKNLLKEKKVEFGSKSKKQDLIGLATGISDLGNEEVVKSKIASESEKEKLEIYTILMRTISFRSKSLYDYNRAKRIGVMKFEISHVHDSDKEFAEMALKENPNALPPFFPYNLSLMIPKIDLD